MTDEPPAPAPVREGTFPKLTEEQRARIAAFAHERRFADGELLWEQGDRNRPLFVVLEGKITILLGADHVVTTHEPGNSAATSTSFPGRPVVVRGPRGGRDARARDPRRALPGARPDRPGALRDLPARVHPPPAPAPGAGPGSVVLIGSRHSAGTLRLQEFLTRNGQPYAYLDVDRDPGVQKMLDGFGVGVDDVPILICRGKRVLKKPTIEEVGECLGLNRFDDELGARRRRRGRRPGGPRRRRLRRLRGARRPGPRGERAGRAGGLELAHRELPRLSDGDLGAGAREPRPRAGGEVRRGDRGRAHRREALLRRERPYRVELGGRRAASRRATVIIATGVQYRKPDLPNLARFEGRRRLLRGDADRGEPLRGRRRHRRRRRQLRGAGGDVPLARGRGACTCSCGAKGSPRACRATSSAASRRRRTSRSARTTQIVALDGRRALERVTWRDAAGDADDGRRPARLPHDGRRPEHGVARKAASRSTRRASSRPGRTSTPSDLAEAKWPLARPPLPLRDEPARRLRRRRRARQQRQARRRGRGRRLRLHPARPSGARGVDGVGEISRLRRSLLTMGPWPPRGVAPWRDEKPIGCS